MGLLANEATNYLLSGQVPRRQGTEHPNIVPYKTFASADGFVILAVGTTSSSRNGAASPVRADLAA